MITKTSLVKCMTLKLAVLWALISLIVLPLLYAFGEILNMGRAGTL